MKRTYETPAVEMLQFNYTDVIVASGNVLEPNVAPEICGLSQNGKFTWHGQSNGCEKIKTKKKDC